MEHFTVREKDNLVRGSVRPVNTRSYNLTTIPAICQSERRTNKTQVNQSTGIKKVVEKVSLVCEGGPPPNFLEGLEMSLKSPIKS